jgi:hypothetical protein
MIAPSHIFRQIGMVILGLSCTMPLSGCTRDANLKVINIHIINRSTTELTNVVATGSGFTQSIGSVKAGEQRSIAVSPRSESGLQLEFDAKGKRFKSLPQGYFEGGSNAKVTATVSPEFTVTVDVK